MSTTGANAPKSSCCRHRLQSWVDLRINESLTEHALKIGTKRLRIGLTGRETGASLSNERCVLEVL
jgi:hypothetical protein